ncbi:2-oxoacid:acceptor oxidoreductase subunit alpha [Virgibacillus sp. MSP4-1]|uniref:2-oxoacid:acceptor oxidoreductase subunit alpha n=1 Tax=Virgibacillus sp. MSP4-1 TaxID=2700081 RepID=UPI0003A4F478|nr:2-oxoacid:acceptor oxidoreductase subunit alpha [Virgibacillus sp. MSP4-1]QHS22322.1 2-oxoacid:acceptor oxidoreductase subunit alpha [Virgibacillus sp. MSP4-1]
MISQFSWKVGGQQGEGIESTGEIFAAAMNHLGYYLYGYRHFSSRIKGGHTNNKIRVSTTPVRSLQDGLDILVAFDQETIDVNIHELQAEGIVIADAKFNPAIPEGSNVILYAVPFTEIARELGSSLMKNMVAIGASSAFLDLDTNEYYDIVYQTFGRKGTKVVENNMKAIEKGAAFVQSQSEGKPSNLKLLHADGKKRMYMIGNDAISIGLLAGGCRFMAAYPITPASEIMEFMIKHLPDYGGTVIQTEDEMAAATMAIGANYAGVRAITASAGPGLSLMMESIGLAGMTETPLVVIDTQRGGPSTGLPTKQEQSDLMAMIYGTHGEISKIVMAPSTVEEGFYDAVEALNLAEEYQCPVILLSDLQLSLGKQTVDDLDYNQVEIRRGKLDVDPDLPELEKGQYFKRYKVTENGISPRILPGTRNGIFHVTGVEHDETGKPSEKAPNRREQMEKRLLKIKDLPKKFPSPVIKTINDEKPDVLFVGYISTRGAIEEAMARLRQDGFKVNHAHLRLLHPFPSEEIKPLIKTANQVIVVEHNATGQLANLLKMNIGYGDKITSVLKFDGTPFLPGEIYHECMQEVVVYGNR